MIDKLKFDSVLTSGNVKIQEILDNFVSEIEARSLYSDISDPAKQIFIEYSDRVVEMVGWLLEWSQNKSQKRSLNTSCKVVGQARLFLDQNGHRDLGVKLSELKELWHARSSIFRETERVLNGESQSVETGDDYVFDRIAFRHILNKATPEEISKVLTIRGIRDLQWNASLIRKCLLVIDFNDSQTLQKLLLIKGASECSWPLEIALNRIVNDDSQTLNLLLNLDSASNQEWSADLLRSALYKIAFADSKTLNRLLNIAQADRMTDWDERVLGLSLLKVAKGDRATLNRVLDIADASNLEYQDHHEKQIDRIDPNCLELAE